MGYFDERSSAAAFENYLFTGGRTTSDKRWKRSFCLTSNVVGGTSVPSLLTVSTANLLLLWS